MPDIRGVFLPHLEAWRRYNALSQYELADKADVGRSSIARAERGEAVSYANARKLADALAISVQQLQTEAPPTALGGANDSEVRGAA